MFTSLVLSSMISLTSAPPVALAKCEVSTPFTQQLGDGNTVTTGAFAVHVRFFRCSSASDLASYLHPRRRHYN